MGTDKHGDVLEVLVGLVEQEAEPLVLLAVQQRPVPRLVVRLPSAPTASEDEQERESQ